MLLYSILSFKYITIYLSIQTPVDVWPISRLVASVNRGTINTLVHIYVHILYIYIYIIHTYVCVCIHTFIMLWGFPWGSAGKESTCHVGVLGSIPGSGTSPGEGKGYPLQYSGLDNSMGYIVHRVTKSWTQLSDFHNNAIRHITRIVYLIRQLSWVLLIVVGGIVESMQELIIGNHLEGYQQICSKCLLLVVEVVCQIIRTNVFL